eukprot:3878415-Pleurochrysis_carterae.AAC.2
MSARPLLPRCLVSLLAPRAGSSARVANGDSASGSEGALGTCGSSEGACMRSSKTEYFGIATFETVSISFSRLLSKSAPVFNSRLCERPERARAAALISASDMRLRPGPTRRCGRPSSSGTDWTVWSAALSRTRLSRGHRAGSGESGSGRASAQCLRFGFGAISCVRLGTKAAARGRAARKGRAGGGCRVVVLCGRHVGEATSGSFSLLHTDPLPKSIACRSIEIGSGRAAADADLWIFSPVQLRLPASFGFSSGGSAPSGARHDERSARVLTSSPTQSSDASLPKRTPMISTSSLSRSVAEVKRAFISLLARSISVSSTISSSSTASAEPAANRFSILACRFSMRLSFFSLIRERGRLRRRGRTRLLQLDTHSLQRLSRLLRLRQLLPKPRALRLRRTQIGHATINFRMRLGRRVRELGREGVRLRLCLRIHLGS